MALYRFPMIECSSCGTVVGHLIYDYYRLSKQLIEDLKENGVPTGSYRVTETGYEDDLTPFVTTYYQWLAQHQSDDPPPVEYKPVNVIARALLRRRELDPADLPFGSKREEDGQLSMLEERFCCLRMLQTDPMGTQI